MKLITPSRKLLLPTRRAFLAGSAGLIASPAIVRAQNIIGGGIWGDAKVSGGSYTPQTPQYATTNIGMSGAGTTQQTSTAQSVGNPTFISTRRVICFVGGILGGGTSMTSATIGGVSAVIHFQAGPSGSANYMSCFSALLGTGTTANIVCNFSGTAAFSLFCTTYYCDNSILTSGTPTSGTATTASATSLTTSSFSETAGGFILGAWYCDAGATSGTMTGFTNDFVFGNVKYSTNHFNPVASTGTGSVTVTWTGAQDMALGAVQFK